MEAYVDTREERERRRGRGGGGEGGGEGEGEERQGLGERERGRFRSQPELVAACVVLCSCWYSKKSHLLAFSNANPDLNQLFS